MAHGPVAAGAPSDSAAIRTVDGYVPSTIPPFRFYLTLSGGASLGAYEAGAAAGLALAVRYVDAEEEQGATIDAVGGASAGALVGFFTAHALLTGLDPERLLHETWVERVNLPLLLSDDSRAPLSFDQLRGRLPEVLIGRPGASEAWRHRLPPVAGNRPARSADRTSGLSYRVRGLRRDSPVTATTYADWGRFELRPGGGLEQMLEPPGRSPLDFVLASAASPGGFAPQLLDRSADAKAYESRGIQGFPESGHLWYADGGMLGSQPLGRVIAAGRSLHGSGADVAGIHLLIDPRSEDASAERWSDPEAAPSWQEGASRALAILSEQSLFDDLRRVEKDNSRIEWARRLAELLGDRLGPEEADVLARFVEEVEAEREGMRADEPHRERDRDGAQSLDAAGLLHRALCEIGGLVGKERIAIDVISPELLQGEASEDVGSLLAGEFMGDFGGFLSRDLRASDFALGYESALAWLREGLCDCGLAEDVHERTIAFVESRRRYRLEEVRDGRATLSDLSLGDRLQLVRLAAHGARVLGAGALDVRSRIPDALGRAIKKSRARLRRG